MGGMRSGIADVERLSLVSYSQSCGISSIMFALKHSLFVSVKLFNSLIFPTKIRGRQQKTAVMVLISQQTYTCFS